MLFKKRKKFETRVELLNNTDFINKFCMELNKFGEMQDLIVNDGIEGEIKNSFIIPLDMNIPAEYSQSYNQYLSLNEDIIWKKILCDDTMECLNDTLKEANNTNHITIYLTNDCSSFDIIEECLGIEVRY